MSTATAAAPTLKFEVGKSYSCRSICDYNTVWTHRVVSRTAHTIKLDNGSTYKPRVYEGKEFIYPQGRYSMAPILRAG